MIDKNPNEESVVQVLERVRALTPGVFVIACEGANGEAASSARGSISEVVALIGVMCADVIRMCEQQGAPKGKVLPIILDAIKLAVEGRNK